MSLPKKFDRRLKSALGLRAVWEPGSEVKLGDVLLLRQGIFTDIARLQDFGIRFRRVRAGERSLSLEAQGVRTTLLQGGVEVSSAAQLAADRSATLEVRFERKDTYFLRTPALTGEEIDDLFQVGRAARDVAEWNHRDFYVVTKLLRASSFTFLGSLSKNRAVTFAGQGRYIKKLLEAGATARVQVTGSTNLDVRIVGRGGPVAMGVARVRPTGRVVVS
jgi:hypothetical protein